VTELPAVYILYDSSLWSGAFLLLIFSVSVWNGGGFYIEVFGRKCVKSICKTLSISRPFISRFERELEALRKELADTTARSGRSSPTSIDTLSNGGPTSEDDLSTFGGTPLVTNLDLPATSDTVVVSVTDSVLSEKKTQ
jgi:hypothetical protein